MFGEDVEEGLLGLRFVARTLQRRAELELQLDLVRLRAQRVANDGDRLIVLIGLHVRLGRRNRVADAELRLRGGGDAGAVFVAGAREHLDVARVDERIGRVFVDQRLQQRHRVGVALLFAKRVEGDVDRLRIRLVVKDEERLGGIDGLLQVALLQIDERELRLREHLHAFRNVGDGEQRAERLRGLVVLLAADLRQAEAGQDVGIVGRLFEELAVDASASS